jgi:hypothetical protein
VLQLATGAYATIATRPPPYPPAAITFPAKPPPPPAGISFFSGLTDWAVLQRAPKAANVYGTLGKGGTAATVTVSSADGAFATYSVEAAIANATWKAALKPMPDGGDVTITAKCTGCADAKAAVLKHVAFGDVCVHAAGCAGAGTGPPAATAADNARCTGTTAPVKAICGCRWATRSPATPPSPRWQMGSSRTSG